MTFPSLHQTSDDLRVSTVQWCSVLAQRFVYSTLNIMLSIVQILANMFALSWTLSHKAMTEVKGVAHLGDTAGHEREWFFALEIALNLMMIFDISMRMCALQDQFFTIWNMADVLVGVLCMLFTAYFLIMHDTSVETERAIIADEVLITMRSFMYLARNCLFLKNKPALDTSMRRVDFSELPMDEPDSPRSSLRWLHGSASHDTLGSRYSQELRFSEDIEAALSTNSDVCM